MSDELGRNLPPDLYEIWITAVRRLYPDLPDEEAITKLETEAEEILKRVESSEPHTWGQPAELANVDAVATAERITAEAAPETGFAPLQSPPPAEVDPNYVCPHCGGPVDCTWPLARCETHGPVDAVLPPLPEPPRDAPALRFGETRVAALSRPRRRFAGDRTGGLLSWLLRAAKALRRGA